ncbi:small ribosomal subunit protein mS27-like [Glandiceps talaboti]
MAVHMCRHAALRVKNLTLSFTSVHRVLCIRTLLSDAYYCNDVWTQRNRLPANLGELIKKMEKKFMSLKGGPIHHVSSVDLDTFINNMETTNHLLQGQDLLYKYRHSPSSYYLRDSTVHSWIRACLEFNSADQAFTTVTDKTHYGLFPDNYTFNLMLDTYLRSGDKQKATKVAIEMMEQEVLSPKQCLSQLLALYTCHQCINSGEEMEEETKKQIGMTLIDSTRGQDHLAARSYHVIGHAMVGNLEKMVKTLSKMVDTGSTPCVVQEAVDTIKDTFLKNEEEDVDQEDDGIIIYDIEAEEKLMNTLKELVECLEKDRVSSEKLDDVIDPYITSQITELEKEHIDQYPSKLGNDYKDASADIQRQIQAKETKLAEIKAKEREIWELMIGEPGKPDPPPVLSEEDMRVIAKKEKYIYRY